MDLRTALKEIISSRNRTSKEVAEHCGVLPSAFSDRGRRGTYKLAFLCRALDIVGYEVAFLPKGAKRVEGGYYLDADCDVERV